MEFTFVLTEQEANIMASALMKLPYEVVAELVDKINKQAAEQREKTKK